MSNSLTQIPLSCRVPTNTCRICKDAVFGLNWRAAGRAALGAIAAPGILAAASPGVIAQPVAEISYNTFLDPNNASDRRAAAQGKMIAEFKARGRQVNYSIIQSAFHQIVADAFQRMILRNTRPDDAYQEVVTKYNEALAKAQ